MLNLLVLQGCANKQNYINNPNQYCLETIPSDISKDCDIHNLGKEKLNEKVSYLKRHLDKIMSNYSAPIFDGNKYYGQITFCIDNKGKINQIELFQPSGSVDLDEALNAAVKKTVILPLPKSECLKSHTEYFKQTLYYDHNDMAAD